LNYEANSNIQYSRLPAGLTYWISFICWCARQLWWCVWIFRRRWACSVII